MATNYTSLLGFALPVTGELSGTWGDTVNNSITQLEEDAIAGTATASVTGGDWTLSTTGGGASNEARKAVLIPTGTPGVSRNIVAPSQSKAYIVDNQSDASVVLKGAATSGVTILTGETALVAWDGVDFIKVGNFGGNGSFVDINVTGTATIATADINGGTVDNAAVGATTPSTGAFTNLSASGTFALTGDQVQVTEGGTGATTASGARANLLAVAYTTTTGSAVLPAGTQAQRDGSPAAGYIRFNSDIAKFEGYNGTVWSSVGGGATGGGSDAVFIENDQTVTTNYTIPASKNAMSTGPITVNSGVTVTVSGGARYVVI